MSHGIFRMEVKLTFPDLKISPFAHYNNHDKQGTNYCWLSACVEKHELYHIYNHLLFHHDNSNYVLQYNFYVRDSKGNQKVTNKPVVENTFNIIAHIDSDLVPLFAEDPSTSWSQSIMFKCNTPKTKNTSFLDLINPHWYWKIQRISLNCPHTSIMTRQKNIHPFPSQALISPPK